MTTKGRKITLGCSGVLVVAIACLWLTPPGRTIRDLWHNGSLGALIAPSEERSYDASNEANLKALYTAMLLYHESEGQFPVGAGWMDAVSNRLTTSDMKPGEGDKKLHNPAYRGADMFGYAMNAAASGKFKGDLKDPHMIVIFESKATTKNAVGDPVKDCRTASSLAITLDGKIVKSK